MPKDTLRLNNLKMELGEAMDLAALYHSKEYQNRLLPRLLKDSQQVWLDPLKFPSSEEFQRAYNIAFAKAEAAKNIMAFLANQDAKVEQIRKQIDTPEKNYAI